MLNPYTMKMNSFFKKIPVLSLLLLIISCGNADDDVDLDLNFGDLGKGKTVDKCLDLGESTLVLSIQEQYTTLPGKVSILFKVSDTEGNPVSGLTANKFTIMNKVEMMHVSIRFPLLNHLHESHRIHRFSIQIHFGLGPQ